MTKELALYERRIVYQIPGMNEAETHQDVTYKSVGTTDLKMDVYTPSGVSQDTRLPGVVFIHGGPIQPDMQPLPKDWGCYISYGQLVAASGMIGVTFNHRYHSLAELDLSSEDVAAAIGFAREHSKSFNLDPDRLCLWFFSGAGRLLHIALHNKSDFRCVVIYYPALDLPQAEGTTRRWDDEMLAKFSPASHFSPDSLRGIPIFFARAGLERPRLSQSVDLFIQKALAANATLDLANHPQGHHAFDILDDDARSRQIIARTLEFIKANV